VKFNRLSPASRAFSGIMEDPEHKLSSPSAFHEGIVSADVPTMQEVLLTTASTSSEAAWVVLWGPISLQDSNNAGAQFPTSSVLLKAHLPDGIAEAALNEVPSELFPCSNDTSATLCERIAASFFIENSHVLKGGLVLAQLRAHAPSRARLCALSRALMRLLSCAHVPSLARLCALSRALMRHLARSHASSPFARAHASSLARSCAIPRALMRSLVRSHAPHHARSYALLRAFMRHLVRAHAPSHARLRPLPRAHTPSHARSCALSCALMCHTTRAHYCDS